MTEIVIVRQPGIEVTEDEKAAARKVLFGAIDGLGAQHKKSWRRLVNWLLNKAEPGEFVELQTRRARSGPFHRRHFAIEQSVFEAQERFTVFDQYMYWIKVGAGWVTWAAGPKGGVVPIPRSVSYAETDEDEFQQFHEQVIEFLRGEHAAKYLWPHLSSAQANSMMNGLLEGFNE